MTFRWPCVVINSYNKTLRVSDSSSVHHQEFSTIHTAGSGRPSWSRSQAVSKSVWHTLLLCVQWKTPGDGQRNCPKHVEFYSKNKFEKVVHLVGFIIRIHSEYLFQLTGHLIPNTSYSNMFQLKYLAISRKYTQRSRLVKTDITVLSVYFGPGYLSRYSDSLRDGRSRIQSRCGRDFPHPSRSALGLYPASCTIGTGSFLQIKRPGHGADHPPQSRAEGKERIELYL